jgi:hypothetical protein
MYDNSAIAVERLTEVHGGEITEVHGARSLDFFGPIRTALELVETRRISLP